ncbi:MAG TPA: DUF1192 domain-containing protein [Hyphomicrobiales bacterium]|nr:DUF1192 domain-containing protein [Hyphomicrobiales bacterium]
MPADSDDDQPRPTVAHRLGEDLASLSVDELGRRIALLKEEIARLEAEIAAKSAHRSAADRFFRSG